MASGDRRAGDEQLELLWYARERGEVNAPAGHLGAAEETERLVREGYVERAAPDLLKLTREGEDRAALLVRSHRLAERLVHDVLGEAYEEGACEFEHVLTPSIVDAICTLLGHPRECPHGRSIPPGECCRSRTDSVSSTVVPLTRLGVGESARIAYVYGDSDRQLHKLENLQIRPGVEVRLHQRAPSFVVECERSTIAMDERVAANIRVWAPKPAPATPESEGERGGHGHRRHRRHGPD